MILIQIKKIELHHAAVDELAYSVFVDAEKWLKPWSVENNFKAIVAPSKEEAIEQLRADLRGGWYIPPRFKDKVLPRHLVFNYNEARADENNRFWIQNLITTQVMGQIDFRGPKS